MLPGYTRSLYGVLELLLPASHFLPIPHENMNTIPFAPRSQRVKYDYINQIDFNADVPVLILSEEKSMLPVQPRHGNYMTILTTNNHNGTLPNRATAIAPIAPNAEAIKQINKTIEATRHNIAPKLNDMRRFVTVAELHEFDMNTHDPAGNNAENILARPLGLIRGRTSL
uniref:Mini-chromosome maintenance complex-binding protein n=1 Tax=Anopheles melas TaxID=34690 RepID=A0A182UAT3_9DIPT